MKNKCLSNPKGWLYAASFGIPFLLLTISLALVDAAPFGDNTILLRDAEIQYIDFAAYLRTIFTGENDLLYSFSKNLGGEMLSLIAYYLASPFNLLFAFASDENLHLVFTLVAVLKLSLCGLTFFHASAKRYGCKAIHLAFSTAYALMAYNVIYGWSIMWLDGVLILPLVGMGLYDLWRDGKPGVYAASLAYALVTNFYIGYMICIASVLFSLVHMFTLHSSWGLRWKRFGSFAGASCVGGFAAAFLWLPAFLSLLEGRAKFDGNTTDIVLNFNVLGLAGKLVAGASSPVQLGSGTPHIFCGTLVLLLVMLFFLNGKIHWKHRLAALGVLGVMLVSFCFRDLNIIWHGFSANYAFNFRYAFIFNYVMIGIAQHSLTRYAEAGKKPLAVCTGLILALILVLIAMLWVLELDFLTVSGCLTSFLALAAVFAVLWRPERWKKYLCTALVTVSCLEMGANCFLSWKPIVDNSEVEMLRVSGFTEFADRVSSAVDYVKEKDDGFYRLEKDFLHDMNDPMLFSYNGVSHFSSSQQKHVLRFLEKMGLKNDRDICVYYHTGSTAEVDSLLGVKYLLSEQDMAKNKGYTLLDTIDGIGIYENPNALPIAMLASTDILAVDLEESDYFTLHNALWTGLCGEDVTLLRQVDYAMTLENLYAVPLDNGNTRYIKEDETQPAAIRFDVPITREEPLYFFFSSYEAQGAEIYINGEYNGPYFHELRWDMTNAGVYETGDTVTVEIRLWEEQLALETAYFYYEDLAAGAAAAEQVKASPVALTRETSSRLTGTFTATEDQMLLFTIPYDTGWRLTMDGEEAEFLQVWDGFLAVAVEEGTHTFEMRYIPRGLTAGCGLSIGAVMAALCWNILSRKRNRNDGKY